MLRHLWIAAALAATAASAMAAPPLVATIGRAMQDSLSAALATRVAQARDEQVAAGTAPADAQRAVEIVIQTVISESGEGTDEALAAIASTRDALGCDTAPNATCPAWVLAALDSVENQIRAVTSVVTSATGGGSSAPASIPPPPSAGAGGGGGGAGYRPA